MEIISDFSEDARSKMRYAFLSLFDVHQLARMAIGLGIVSRQRIEIRNKSRYGNTYKWIPREQIEAFFDFDWDKKIMLAMKAEVMWSLHGSVEREAGLHSAAKTTLMRGLMSLLDIEHLRKFVQSLGIDVALPERRPFRREVKQPSRVHLSRSLVKNWDELNVTDRLLQIVEACLCSSAKK